MIRGRLKRAQMLLTVAVFLVPLASFAIAGYFRFGTHLIPNYSADVDPFTYFGLLLLTTVFWSLAAEHYELTSLEHHLLARGKSHRILLACLTTYAAVLAIGFFYRGSTFSRVFIWISAFNLFVLTLLLQRAFRWYWKNSRLKDRAAIQRTRCLSEGWRRAESRDIFGCPGKRARYIGIRSMSFPISKNWRSAMVLTM
jgi:hypothetical protein